MSDDPRETKKFFGALKTDQEHLKELFSYNHSSGLFYRLPNLEDSVGGIHLGSFSTKEEAIKVRLDAELKYHKDFARAS